MSLITIKSKKPLHEGIDSLIVKDIIEVTLGLNSTHEYALADQEKNTYVFVRRVDKSHIQMLTFSCVCQSYTDKEVSVIAANVNDLTFIKGIGTKDYREMYFMSDSLLRQIENAAIPTHEMVEVRSN